MYSRKKICSDMRVTMGMKIAAQTGGGTHYEKQAKAAGTMKGDT